MLKQQTLDKPYALRWFGLAEASRKQTANAEVAALNFEVCADANWIGRSRNRSNCGSKVNSYRGRSAPETRDGATAGEMEAAFRTK